MTNIVLLEMSMVLLDTNIVSFLLKRDTRAQDYEVYLQDKKLAISVMTVAELFQWAKVRHWGTHKTKELENLLVNDYHTLTIDVATCRLWGEIRADCRSVGRPISAQDAWIAATALQHRLPLITHNPSDFKVIKELNIITTLD
jgi:tRNA(fMet)-specific endonuclease VapC